MHTDGIQTPVSMKGEGVRIREAAAAHLRVALILAHTTGKLVSRIWQWRRF